MRRSKQVHSKVKRKRAGRISRPTTSRRRSKRGFSASSELRNAYRSGMYDAKRLRSSGFPIELSDSLKQQMNESWTHRCGQRQSLTVKMIADSNHYAEGFMAELNLRSQSWLPVPKHKSAAAVVLTSEGLNVAAIQELLRLPLEEVIVVLEAAGENGFTDIRRMPGITIIHMTESLGRDVGRAVGAKLVKAETILFTNGSVVIPAERLAPFLAAVDSSADIALSDTSGSLGLFSEWDDITRVKAFMNWTLGRRDLLASSAADLPQAWSRKAIQLVGAAALAVPPVAHQSAIAHKLRIANCLVQKAAHGVGRKSMGLFKDTVTDRLIVGDHIEALTAAIELRGSRLSFLDRWRNRIVDRGGTP